MYKCTLYRYADIDRYRYTHTHMNFVSGEGKENITKYLLWQVDSDSDKAENPWSGDNNIKLNEKPVRLLYNLILLNGSFWMNL